MKTVTVVKLIDIQRLISLDKALGNILTIIPEGTNYKFNSENKNIVLIKSTLHKSTVPLFDHLQLKNVTTDCYMKFQKDDFILLQDFIKNQ